MRRAAPILGWLLALAYFGGLAAVNATIVIVLYRPPEGPWPGWSTLIEADLLYGGAGILAGFATRWIWRRLTMRASDTQGLWRLT